MTIQLKTTAVLLCLLCIVGFGLFYKLGAVPLADPDEPRYAESAREMIERGSIMVPYFNYEPRINKPVLYYWSICASYMAAGRFGVQRAPALSPRRPCHDDCSLLFYEALLRPCRRRTFLPYYGLKPAFFCARQAHHARHGAGAFYDASLFSFYLGWQEQIRRARSAGMLSFIFFRLARPGSRALWVFSSRWRWRF